MHLRVAPEHNPRPSQERNPRPPAQTPRADARFSTGVHLCVVVRGRFSVKRSVQNVGLLLPVYCDKPKISYPHRSLPAFYRAANNCTAASNCRTPTGNTDSINAKVLRQLFTPEKTYRISLTDLVTCFTIGQLRSNLWGRIGHRVTVLPSPREQSTTPDDRSGSHPEKLALSITSLLYPRAADVRADVAQGLRRAINCRVLSMARQNPATLLQSVRSSLDAVQGGCCKFVFIRSLRFLRRTAVLSYG
jgi:hypothetical protein